MLHVRSAWQIENNIDMNNTQQPEILNHSFEGLSKSSRGYLLDCLSGCDRLFKPETV